MDNNSMKINIPSSFVAKTNKLEADKGSGEAKLFIGPVKKSNEFDSFFNDYSESNRYFFDIKQIRDYLLSVFIEYKFNVFQKYKEVNSLRFQELMSQIESLNREEDFILEKFEDTSRYYIRGIKKKGLDIWTLVLRKIALPKITDVSIVKVDDTNFRFELSLNGNKDAVDDREADQEMMEESFSQELSEDFRQYIYFGAPGTGKSYQLNVDSKKFAESNVERVTFHPNMTYGQFVGVFKPFPIEDNKITYQYIPGPLMNQLVQALLHPESAYLLIVEELNRANVAATFGDMFQLLDRKSNFESEYPINISEDLSYYFEKVVYENEDADRVEKMKSKIANGLIFPSNFFIWTTMNSADQGVMPMDTAFKRRWEQKYFGINQAYEDNKADFDGYSKILVNTTGGSRELIAWNDIREFLNERLTALKVPEDKLMGPYFISKNILESDNEKLTESFKTKVLMYLFDDAAKQKRKDFFDIAQERMMYSEVLKAFEERGVSVFKDSQKLEKEVTSSNK